MAGTTGLSVQRSMPTAKQPLITPQIQPTPLPPLTPPGLQRAGAPQPSRLGGPRRHTLLDGIITGLFGPSTAEMTAEEGARVDKQRAAKKMDAYQSAESAWKNPGEQWMAGPAMGGGDGDLIKSILKLFGGGGG